MADKEVDECTKTDECTFDPECELLQECRIIAEQMEESELEPFGQGTWIGNAIRHNT